MVYTKTYAAPPIDRDEIRRYAGMNTSTPAVDVLLDEVIAEAESVFTYKVCYTELPLTFTDTAVDLGTFAFRSDSVHRVLTGCHSVILFAATVGIAFDRMLAKYSKTAPAKALLLSAFGTERVESLCDAFNRDITAEYGCTAPRFSAGYGDCALDVQRDIVRVLDCSRKIGVTLNDSLLMSPTKSVTAFIGIGGNSHTAYGCAHCNKTDCIHRRTV